MDILKRYQPRDIVPGVRVLVKESPATRSDGTARLIGTVIEHVGPRSGVYVVRLDDGRTVYLHYFDLLTLWVRS